MSIELSSTVNSDEACFNLLAAVFEQARHDWISACNKKAKLGVYNQEQYEKDRYTLKISKSRQEVEYQAAKHRTDIFISCEKTLNDILLFFNSKWFVTICNGCNLDTEAVKDQFISIKNKIVNNK